MLLAVTFSDCNHATGQGPIPFRYPMEVPVPMGVSDVLWDEINRRENSWRINSGVLSGKLTWQWKMYSLLNMGIFHCYVSLPEGNCCVFASFVFFVAGCFFDKKELL